MNSLALITGVTFHRAQDGSVFVDVARDVTFVFYAKSLD